jgi:hypothetical protein
MKIKEGAVFLNPQETDDIVEYVQHTGKFTVRIYGQDKSVLKQYLHDHLLLVE